MHQPLSDSELRVLARCLPEPIFVLDEDGRYADVIGCANRRKYDDPGGLVGRRMHDVLDATVADQFLDWIQLALEKGELHTSEYALSRDEVDKRTAESGPTGTQWFEATIVPLELERDGRRLVAWVAYNATARHDMLRQLREQHELLALKSRELETQALTDEATGLANRRQFFAILEHEFRKARTGRVDALALLLIDLDHFKRINDEHGHAAGDAMLHHLAGILMDGRRESDLAARIGGEEFAVILPGADLEDAARVAEALRSDIANHPLVFDDTLIRCTASIGVVEYDSRDEDAELLLKHGDRALYQAKDLGRNQVVFHRREDRLPHANTGD